LIPAPGPKVESPPALASARKVVAAAADIPARIAALSRPLVFTNGVFDVLHRGHVTYLEQARALGAALVVAVNSDASVRRLGKGDDRPLNPLADRMAVLAALAAVDLVVPFDDDTPRALIVACMPDVLVKGGFVAIPFAFERSTTALVRRIRG
jgi:rfaE bifunctional protein nucleotidyltransferase chain/domain